MQVQISYHDEERYADYANTIDELYGLLHQAYLDGESHVHLSFGKMDCTWKAIAECIVPLNEERTINFIYMPE